MASDAVWRVRHRSGSSALSFLGFTPSLHRIVSSGLPRAKERLARAFVCSLAFTSILRGARAGLYPLLNLNSMESPIGPNSERGNRGV